MARRRSADFALKQQDILEHAAAVFAAHGMDKASMSRIAVRAGVSKALLYHYYPDKEHLIASIITAHLTALDHALATADAATLPPEHRLRQLVGAMLETFRGAGHFHKVRLDGLSTLSPAMRANIIDRERLILRRFSAVLTAIQPALAGDRRLTPITLSLLGMLYWVNQWFREDGTLSRSDYADLATNLLLHGLVQGPVSGLT